MSRLPCLHHVMIAIPPGGEELARAFYVDQLELREIPKPDALASRGGLWLSSATLAVHLGIDPLFVPARKAHIALTVEDLEVVRNRLDRDGCVATKIESELPGYLRFYVDDPFGNRIELMQTC